MIKKIILSILIIASIPIFAHEGHDETPGAFKANHGGAVKAGKEINLEYVVSGAQVKLFLISHEGKDLSPNEVKLTATTQLPKGKAEVAKLEIQDGAFVTHIDFKNTFRVEMNVSASKAGKTDTFKLQIEK